MKTSVSSIVEKMEQQVQAANTAGLHAKGSPDVDGELPQVSISSYSMPVNGVASVMFKVLGKAPSALGVSVAAGNLFDQNIRVIPGTIKLIDSGFGVHSMSAKVCANNVKVAVPDHAKEPNNFRCIARNLFMDARDDSTWKMVDMEDGSRVLVRDNVVETDADLESLLSSSSSVTHHFTKENRTLQAQASGFKQGAKVGQPISFVNHQKQSVFGFVVVPDHNGKIGVLSNGQAAPEYVSRCAIVKVLDEQQVASQLKFPELSVSMQSVSADPGIDTLVAYYRKLYGMNSDYFKQIEQQIQSYTFV